MTARTLSSLQSRVWRLFFMYEDIAGEKKTIRFARNTVETWRELSHKCFVHSQLQSQAENNIFGPFPNWSPQCGSVCVCECCTGNVIVKNPQTSVPLPISGVCEWHGFELIYCIGRAFICMQSFCPKPFFPQSASLFLDFLVWSALDTEFCIVCSFPPPPSISRFSFLVSFTSPLFVSCFSFLSFPLSSLSLFSFQCFLSPSVWWLL